MLDGKGKFVFLTREIIMHTVHCTVYMHMYVKCMHCALEGMRFAKINFLVGSGGGVQKLEFH